MSDVKTAARARVATTAPRAIEPRAIEPGVAKPTAAKPAAAASEMMSELRVSGHLMTLDAGLFCVVQTPSRAADPRTGLPGVRLSLPPGSASRPEAVSISGFRGDGWLSGAGDAALVRVAQGPAQLLVTIYQASGATEGSAPNLQVMRLLESAGQQAATPPGQQRADQQRAGSPARGTVMEMVAHIQGRGDVGAMFGEWLGEAGSKSWIEGFGLAPVKGVAPRDIEYQAVLGRGWLSPWVEGGQFCGSRAMALPVLGLKVRLRGDAEATHTVSYSASFIDGTKVGPVSDGEACESEALVGMESFTVQVATRAPAATAAPTPPVAAAKPEKAEQAKPGKVKSGKAAKAKPEPARRR